MIEKPKIDIQIRQLGVILVILLCCVAAYAEWTIYKRIEQRSPEGHVLRLDTVPENSIRAWFLLRNNTAGVFKHKMPLYQVDNNDIHDLQLIKNIKTREDRWIRWIISDKTGKPSPDLIELMDGTEVRFQYYLPDGTIKETTFDLKGAREAIGEILNTNMRRK